MLHIIFKEKCEIFYGLDASFTLIDVSQDSKNMRDLFAILFSSIEYSKASYFDWKSITKWLHRTKSLVSVFLKRDGNMELVVSVTFLCCGNVENQVSLFLSRFRHVSWTEISRHVSVLFLSVDFRCCLFPLRFCKRISNLFAITKKTFTAFTQIGVAPNKPRLFGVIKFQSNANSKRKRKLPS